MPTRRVQQQLVPKAEMTDKDWCEVIEEWLRTLKPTIEKRRLPLLQTTPIYHSGWTVGGLWEKAYGNVEFDPEYQIEGIWGRPEKQSRNGDKVTEKFFGWSPSEGWLEVKVIYRSGCADGHSVYCHFESIGVQPVTLEEVVASYGPEYILWHIRDQLWQFQKLNREIGDVLDYQAKRLDEDYQLLDQAGVKLPRNPDWDH